MNRSKIVILFVLLTLLSFPGFQKSAKAKTPPGADLVDLKFTKGMGYALLSRYELFLSGDGIKWRPSGLSRTGDVLTGFAVGPDFILVGSESGRIYRTSDGRSWEPLDAPQDPFRRTVTSLRNMAVGPKGTDVLASSGMGVVRSIDRGSTWQAISDPFWDVAEARQILGVGYAGKEAVVVTGSGVYVDSKTGFTPFHNKLPEKVEPTVAVSRKDRILLALPGAGIFEATSGSGWKKLATAPHNTLAFLGWTDQGYLAAAPFSNLFEGDGKAQSWQRVGSFSPAFVPISNVPIPKGALILFRGKGLMRYEGGVLSLVDLPGSLASIYSSLDLDGLRVVGTQGGVFISEDSERNWKDVTPTNLGSPVVTLLKASDGRILLGSLGSGVFVSRDGGRTWEDWGQDLGTANTVNALVEENGKILAATENGLMERSLSPGLFWVPVDRGLPRTNVSSLFQSRDTIWAATSTGLYSAKEGKVFKPVKGFSGPVSSFDHENGQIVALVGGDAILGSPKGKVERLSRLPNGTDATAVAFMEDTILAGSGQGLYRLANGNWVRIGTLKHPVTKLVSIDNKIGAITRGGGTFWLP